MSKRQPQEPREIVGDLSSLWMNLVYSRVRLLSRGDGHDVTVAFRVEKAGGIDLRLCAHTREEGKSPNVRMKERCLAFCAVSSLPRWIVNFNHRLALQA